MHILVTVIHFLIHSSIYLTVSIAILVSYRFSHSSDALFITPALNGQLLYITQPHLLSVYKHRPSPSDSDTVSTAVVSTPIVSTAVVSTPIVSTMVVSTTVVSNTVVSTMVVSTAVVSNTVVITTIVSTAVVSTPF